MVHDYLPCHGLSYMKFQSLSMTIHILNNFFCRNEFFVCVFSNLRLRCGKPAKGHPLQSYRRPFHSLRILARTAMVTPQTKLSKSITTHWLFERSLTILVKTSTTVNETLQIPRIIS